MTSGAFTVAVFRALDDATGTLDALARLGCQVALAPVTQIVTLTPPYPPGPFDFVVATSAKAFAALSGLADLPLFVVGEKTARAARRLGFSPQAPAADVAALIPRLPAGRALYLAGRDRKPELERALTGRIAVMETYEARAREGWRLEEARAVAGADAALHYSARGAALAGQLARDADIGEAFERLAHVCLSREVAKAVGARRVYWPQRPHEDALLDVLESALADRL